MENAQQEILCPGGDFQLWTNSHCCYGARGPAPHTITLTPLLLPTPCGVPEEGGLPWGPLLCRPHQTVPVAGAASSQEGCEATCLQSAGNAVQTGHRAEGHRTLCHPSPSSHAAGWHPAPAQGRAPLGSSFHTSAHFPCRAGRARGSGGAGLPRVHPRELLCSEARAVCRWMHTHTPGDGLAQTPPASKDSI